MSRSKIVALPKLTSNEPEMNIKDISMLHDLKLSITKFNNDVVLSIRIKKNQLPRVVKSLAELSVDVNSDQFDLIEIKETAGESSVSYYDPYPVFRIDDKRYLTTREVKIMERLSLGRFNKEIAIDLKIKECTVKNNLQRIFRKFMINNRSEAILEYQKCKTRYKEVS